MVRERSAEGGTEVRVVLDWFTELRAAARDRARRAGRPCASTPGRAECTESDWE